MFTSTTYRLSRGLGVAAVAASCSLTFGLGIADGALAPKLSHHRTTARPQARVEGLQLQGLQLSGLQFQGRPGTVIPKLMRFSSRPSLFRFSGLQPRHLPIYPGDSK